MPNMGRKHTKNLNLPPRIRARIKAHGKVWYYYDAGGKPRKEIPLGCEYTAAIKKWAELEADQVTGQITFKQVAERYIREVLPTKAARTQRDNIKELKFLYQIFNDPPAPLESITPVHIRAYLDWRGQSAKTRANREKALFSHIWNMARAWGITDKPNPCAGIKGFTETGRDIYIEDDILAAVWEVADHSIRDALDLAYLTGQRPADTLTMRVTDIRDGILYIDQDKTKQKLRMNIEGELAALIDRIADRKKGYKVHTLNLVCNEKGQALSELAFRSRFTKARTIAAKLHPELSEAIHAFQFRDLRAKAGTDKSESGTMQDAQKQLGHKSIVMTEHYIRARKGQKVSPTK